MRYLKNPQLKVSDVPSSVKSGRISSPAIQMSTVYLIFFGLLITCTYHDAAVSERSLNWCDLQTILMCGYNAVCKHQGQFSYYCICNIDGRPSGPNVNCDPNRATYALLNSVYNDILIPKKTYEIEVGAKKEESVKKEESENKESIESADSVNCLRNQLKCADGKKCVSLYFRCDGIYQCDDGSDEIRCNARRCPVGYYRCTSGQCIPDMWTCDGTPDCDDLSDEKHCAPSKPGSKCLENQFQCSNGWRCIAVFNRCDDSSDCIDGSDEKGCDDHRCPGGYHRCDADGRCVADMFVCDGLKNCYDGSDEMDCAVIQCGNHLARRKATCGVSYDLSRGYKGIHPFLSTNFWISTSTIALGNPSKVTGWYPRNVTELEDYCSAIRRYVPCLINLEFKCNGGYKRNFGWTLDACAEGSAFHKGVQDNLECLYNSWINHYEMKTPCKYNSDEIHYQYKKLQKNTEMHFFLKLSEIQRTHVAFMLDIFHDLGCFLNHLRCPVADVTAEDVILEIHAKEFAHIRQDLYDLKNITFEIMENLPIEYKMKMYIKEGVKKYEDKCEEINCTEYEDKLGDLHY